MSSFIEGIGRFGDEVEWLGEEDGLLEGRVEQLVVYVWNDRAWVGFALV